MVIFSYFLRSNCFWLNARNSIIVINVSCIIFKRSKLGLVFNMSSSNSYYLSISQRFNKAQEQVIDEKEQEYVDEDINFEYSLDSEVDEHYYFTILTY